MKPYPAHPNPGFELDWLATDQVGHVALFSTGGYGPVPKVVTDHLADLQTAINQVSSLPIFGACAEGPSGNGNFEFWVEPYRRGASLVSIGAPFQWVLMPV